MITRYQRRLLLSYALNVASRFDHKSLVANAVASWLEKSIVLLETGRDQTETPAGRLESDGETGQPGAGSNGLREELARLFAWTSEGGRSRVDGEPLLSRNAWEHLKDIMAREVGGLKNARADSMARRIRELARVVGLSRTDTSILELLLRLETQPPVESLVRDLLTCVAGRGYRLTLGNRVLPDMLGLSYNTCSARLSPNSPLIRTGLAHVEDDGDINIVDRLKRLAFATADSPRDVGQLLFGTAPQGNLLWSDFEHVTEGRDHVERLIRGALKAGATGVNVLIYGPPGTGKTEFCRTLAARLGVTLHSVGEADDDGQEPNRYERLQELILVQHVFGGSDNTLLLFDEMEDLLADSVHMNLPYRMPWTGLRGGSQGSKVYMNRLLEQNTVPTLWTSNSAEMTCPTVLRRMMFALELRQPSRKVRARIWARQLARHGIASDATAPDELAREYDVSPGVVAGATAAAELVEGGGIADVRRGARSLARLLSGEKPPQRAPAEFDPALVRSDTDPVQLADRFARWGARRVSLCLSGPPGTGKSAFVRYLAERMGLEVEQKRASDLLSMWVGGTEKQIAAAFAQAREDRHFLVFDEADSLLADRRLAHRSWEVSQVNEMLTWMESHPLPFACTTNFAEHLDVATLRRFDFKIELEYLSVDQVRSAFRLFFRLAPPAGLSDVRTLTPGDFAVVRRRAEVLDCLDNPGALSGMLREESEAKPDLPKRIGFGG